MAMDVTPLVPEGRKIIKSYGDGSFQVNEEVHKTHIILFPEEVVVWNLATDAEFSHDLLTIESLSPVIERKHEIELLIIGTGSTHTPIPESFRAQFRGHGISIEFMSTGAACRTYNVLLSEERKVAAALFVVR